MTGPYESDGRTKWYDDNGVELYLNDKAVAIDTDAKTRIPRLLFGWRWLGS